jgi:hypothetical protein
VPVREETIEVAAILGLARTRGSLCLAADSTCLRMTSSAARSNNRPPTITAVIFFVL